MSGLVFDLGFYKSEADQNNRNYLPIILLLVSTIKQLVLNSSFRCLIRNYCDGFLLIFKVGLLPSKKVVFIYFNERPLKLMKMLFISCKNLFSFLRYLNFWCFGYAEKRLDKKTNVNFKIYEVKDWTANNYNTHIAQYLKK